MTSSKTEDQRLLWGSDEPYKDPLLYDAEYGHQCEDIGWYREQVKSHLPSQRCLLELGAGTGRITIPLAQDDHSIIAMDRMPEMLSHLREKAGTLVDTNISLLHGELCKIPLESSIVPLVIAPFNVLMHLYTWQDLLTCFREVWRVLEPKGWFIFDVLLPDLKWLLLNCHKRHAIEKFKDPHTGESLYYSTNHDYDPDTQICHIRIYYDRIKNNRRSTLHRSTPIRTVHLAHRQIFPEELRALLTCAGFAIHQHDGDFSGLALESEVQSQNIVCRKVARLARP